MECEALRVVGCPLKCAAWRGSDGTRNCEPGGGIEKNLTSKQAVEFPQSAAAGRGGALQPLTIPNQKSYVCLDSVKEGRE